MASIIPFPSLNTNAQLGEKQVCVNFDAMWNTAVSSSSISNELSSTAIASCSWICGNILFRAFISACILFACFCILGDSLCVHSVCSVSVSAIAVRALVERVVYARDCLCVVGWYLGEGSSVCMIWPGL